MMPNGVIGNTTDSGSVKSRFEPWLGNIIRAVCHDGKPPFLLRFTIIDTMILHIY